MEETRLPSNGKEGFLYGGIICLTTVIVMMLVNLGIANGGIDLNVILNILMIAPIMFVIGMLLETLLVGRIAEKLVMKFTEPSDSFNTKILFNILFCVTGMSFIMTIVGAYVGQLLGPESLSLEPIITFPSHWPRNFFAAFWCEVLLAQPLARFAMKKLHKHQANKQKEEEKGEEENEKSSCYNNR